MSLGAKQWRLNIGGKVSWLGKQGVIWRVLLVASMVPLIQLSEKVHVVDPTTPIVVKEWSAGTECYSYCYYDKEDILVSGHREVVKCWKMCTPVTST